MVDFQLLVMKPDSYRLLKGAFWESKEAEANENSVFEAKVHDQ